MSLSDLDAPEAVGEFSVRVPSGVQAVIEIVNNRKISEIIMPSSFSF
jgi:hypothetical protein